MIYGLENIITISIAILAFIIVIGAQININTNYSKYKKIKNKKNITGSEAARMILDKNGLSHIYVVETGGNLTDHYDPSRKIIKLSKDIYNGTSIAAVSVAAHEVGHAIQDKDGYTFMKIRGALVPFVNLVSYLGYFSIIISIIAGITGYLKLGILIEVVALIFQLVTLPVEFDASARAKKELITLEITDKDEAIGTKKMLRSAAMTYVASLISSILNLLRLVIMLNDRKDS